MAPVTIWGSDTTRSDLIKASCAELAVPFDFVALDWNGKEHKSEAYLKVHRIKAASAATRWCVLTRLLCAVPQVNPFGQTPAFKDGDLLLVRAPGCGRSRGRGAGACCRQLDP